MKSIKSIGLMLTAALLMNVSFAQKNEKTVEVGGAAMYPSKNIVENAVNSKEHTTLVAAVKAAGLVELYKALVLLPYSLLPMMHLACYPKARWRAW